MKLLLVEDDAALVSAVTRGLRGAGYAVDTAGSAEECVGLLRINTYDIIVLDLGLPDVDGLVLLRRVRDQHIATPVLVLTARGELTDRVAGLDAGADDYLQKPFAFPELLARLRPSCDAACRSRRPSCGSATWSSTRPASRCAGAGRPSR